MASQERRRSIGSVLSPPRDKDGTLAAPPSYSKGLASSTVSIASSNDDVVSKPTDGATDRRKSRQNSEDGRSDASSSHRRRMSKLFKSRKKRDTSISASASREDLSFLDPDEPVPPVPELKRPGINHPYQSDDSLGLAKSVASSLLTDDSDSET